MSSDQLPEVNSLTTSLSASPWTTVDQPEYSKTKSTIRIIVAEFVLNADRPSPLYHYFDSHPGVV